MIGHIRRSTIKHFGALALLFPCMGAADGRKPVVPKNESVDAVIQRLIVTPPTSQALVERALGVRLRMIEDNGDWRMFEADGQLASSSITRIDYRQPLAAKDGQGAHLVIEFGGGCHELGALRSRFGPFEAGPLPSPHAKNATGYLQRGYPWGSVSFGYRLLTPDCLSSVVFDIHGQGMA